MLTCDSGLVATIFPFLGADGAIHMSEEVKDARRNVPRALLASVTINGFLGLGMVIAILFTLGNEDDIATITSAAVSGSPLVDYFWFVLEDRAFATGLTSLLVAMFIFAAVAVLASTSRVTWAFARDNGLPGSTWIKKGQHRRNQNFSGILTVCSSSRNTSSTLVHCLVVRHLPFAKFHQHRLECRFQRYRFANDCMLFRFLWYSHCFASMETSNKPASGTRTMEHGKIWPGCQHHIGMLASHHLDIHVLSDRHTCYSVDNELELRIMGRMYDHWARLVLHQTAQGIYRA